MESTTSQFIFLRSSFCLASNFDSDSRLLVQLFLGHLCGRGGWCNLWCFSLWIGTFWFPTSGLYFFFLLLPIHERLFTPQCFDKSLKQKHRFSWFRLQVGETQVNTLGIAPLMVLLFSFLGGPWFVISLRALELPNKPTTYTQRKNYSWLGYFMVFLKNMHFMDVIWCHLATPGLRSLTATWNGCGVWAKISESGPCKVKVIFLPCVALIRISKSKEVSFRWFFFMLGCCAMRCLLTGTYT